MTVHDLAEKTGKNWEELQQAQELTFSNLEKIATGLGHSSLASSDVDIVVFGSIARHECTKGSDVDWTLLIDGQANASHINTAHVVGNALASTGLADPGTTGMFGQTTFSHDLIHYIGGEDDTNHNLSRRLLLLLESKRILLADAKSTDLTAYNRVVRAVINQYVKNDSGFTASGKENVPRFLLNDIIRFWRTMCVDFAYKQRDQQGKKWALRNIKLRMARRLIYVKGLLMCYASYKTEWDTETISKKLITNVNTTPLDLIVEVLTNENIKEEIIIEIIDSYNEYLKILNDEKGRKYLSDLKMEDAYGDEEFESARENSHRFQKALNNVFIFEESNIQEFTLKYAIF